MNRVCITGGAGFIGSHLCQRFLDEGHELLVFDNFVTGRQENISRFRSHDRFSFHKEDITESITVAGDLDWVIHLASLASPAFYQENPIETLQVGAIGTQKTLELALEKDATYLFASTSEVYGDPDVNPQPEDYRGRVDPFGPRACYDESKRYGESLVWSFKEQYGLDVRIARIFNTYGPRMRIDDGRVLPTFVRQALTGEDLTVYGDGKQTRSFCFISDLVEGLRRLLASDLQTPVNVGNPDERTILELAEMLLEMTDSESSLVYEPLPPHDPRKRCPDISKVRSELNWEPTVELEDGLERMIDHFKSVINSPVSDPPTDGPSQ
ncbi:UDP-glucose 4-epimerase [Natrinema saccharevitans]|uniref:UDP-glucose 4-epimerase n=1 Tax=Natrinema saccharevitans TaxID=301967 RepID=A0A1S8AVG5_9EURY|nr:UDP-glucuronic acid decarboxylase family protein [Natrinema saccharevitans]OLZ40853.1 UDP-glucose 4-epimerase [Natrinema saccharevitans]